MGVLRLPPRRQVGLEVKGRRTGRPHTVALVIAGYEGEHHLVSMLGECEWVKNVRASGEAHIISGRRRKVKLEEVSIERRASIIKEYLRLAPGGRPHIGLGTTATLADCQRVAPNHPVFPNSVSERANPETSRLASEPDTQVGFFRRFVDRVDLHQGRQTAHRPSCPPAYGGGEPLMDDTLKSRDPCAFGSTSDHDRRHGIDRSVGGKQLLSDT